MRLVALASALLLAACSDAPATEPPTPAPDAGTDARAACGVVGETVECICAVGRGTGRCLATGMVDRCDCPETDAGREDSRASSPDAAADTAPEVATDTGPVEPRMELERALCVYGAPRLSWSDAAACVDTELGSMPCTHRIARDGRVRCMPRAYSAIGGYSDGACTSAMLTWATDPVPRYMLTDAGAVETYRGSHVDPWYLLSGGACTVQSGVSPFGLPMKPSGDYGDAVYVKRAVADVEFAGAAL